MSKPRIIAFYLPQFHPIKENDEWWGKGFTEWTNVGKAKPLFKGHDQPRVPTELGYYDLRLKEVREAQAQLAREAGVEGFMYWHYWFGGGKTLMADIFKDVLESGKPDFPFCLGWANHSWYSKLWNGSETKAKTLLMEQTYPGKEDARVYFDSLLPAFRDKRYIKVNGSPLFYVFAPDDLPDDYIRWFKEWIVEAGFPGIYLVGNMPTDSSDKRRYLERGFDAVTYARLMAVVDRKGQVADSLVTRAYRKAQRFAKGLLLHRPPFMESYRKASQSFVTEAESASDVHPTILPQWDHTPRSGWNGILLYDAKPEYFKEVAKRAMTAVSTKPEEEQIIFLKSWNEWGEGNYMEPDLTHGRGYIDALRSALDESAGKNHHT